MKIYEFKYNLKLAGAEISIKYSDDEKINHLRISWFDNLKHEIFPTSFYLNDKEYDMMEYDMMEYDNIIPLDVRYPIDNFLEGLVI